LRKNEKERDEGNKIIYGVLNQRKTFYRILGRAAPLAFKFFTDTIEKKMKIFQQ